MRAVLIENPGPESRLKIGHYPTPDVTEDALLVRVKATALNRADLLQRSGKYPVPAGASDVLGLEMAGEVVEVGATSQGWTVGDRVCGLLPGGGYAEYVAIPHRMAMRIPASLSYEEAAAIPEVFLTAHQALFWLGDVEEGETVLIHAGASGVGTAAIQLANAVKATALVTSSTKKIESCQSLGAALAIDYTSQDFAEAVLAFTDGEGVDCVVDVIGAAYFDRNIKVLRLDGVLVVLAMMGGSKIDQVDLRRLFRKRLHLKTSTLRSRSAAYKEALTGDFKDRFFPMFEDGRLKPVIDRVMDWNEVEAAHQHMTANRNVGKIVLQVG